ncbi:MAG: hypothetical protein EXQ90_00540 [Rhodospirillales bacterium]|nr:hypothetical protein [Rhodospirillales bacterium]
MARPIEFPRRGSRRFEPSSLDGLREQIRKLERGSARAVGLEAMSFGDPDIDAALPWGGLRRAAIHEILGSDGASWGFVAGTAARLAGDGGAILWCRRGEELYGPGLAAFGIDLKRLVVIRTRTATETLWAMEEGLRSSSLAVAIGETFTVPPIALRRLQLAAEAGGVTGLLLRPTATAAATSPALTRWKISAAPTMARARTAKGTSVWRIDLLRCRGGVPAAWIVEWCNEPTRGFRVVADLRDRSSLETVEPREIGGQRA